MLMSEAIIGFFLRMTAPFMVLFCAKTGKEHVFVMERNINSQYLRGLIFAIYYIFIS